ncbi:MAG: AraC family transcriptional regulator [Deltaproteobacteria bacterium]|nr:AraC family transcriptional regulator [Deltaproteobacteria bacterium]MBW2446208.1 AraC family transcriptional regulator [Deltaproteobacteria bacterium]
MAESTANTSASGSVDAILPLLEYLENEGFDLKALLARVGIPRTVLEDTKARFPKDQLEALWRVASEVSGDPAVALRVSTMVKTNTLGIIGYLASVSESGRTAFELVKGLTPLLWEDFECELESEGDLAFIRCGTGTDPGASRFTSEYAIGVTITMSRAFGATRVGPLEARFSYPAPEHADEYERILRVPVRFDAGEDGVLLPISMMDSLNPSADAALRLLLERYAADQLASIPTRAGFGQRVRTCILSMLPQGSVTADTVAAQFSMSNRTLRRRLRDEATSYQEIFDDVRVELARHYLTKERRGIDDVAFLLGFSDPSAFTKAFRRWTGKTPADFVRTESGASDG